MGGKEGGKAKPLKSKKKEGDFNKLVFDSCFDL